MFTDTFQPNDLDAKGFKEFALHVMDGYFVDMNQPGQWTRVCRPNGVGVSQIVIGREIEPKIAAFGGVLLPNLLSKIIRTFLIHGPAVAEEFAFKRQTK